MTRLTLKLETRAGVFGQRHTLAHVAARGIGWCILSDGIASGWHTAYADYASAQEAFDQCTTPVAGVES